MLEQFPAPNEPGNFDNVYNVLAQFPNDKRYRVGCWWRLFHERFWAFRGMENLMVDYYDEPERLMRLGEKLCEFYKVIIRRYREAGCDAIFTGDDLGHQTGPMMSPATFKELYFPLYKELIGYTHGLGMHFLLHSCGDNTLLMEMLIDAGVDAFHPVQRGCMNWKDTVEKFGDRITFIAGVDVQHLMPEESPEEIQKGIREMIKIFHKPNGGLALAMGNGITTDISLEKVKAAYEVMFSYR
jgi:uroporphyrinogen decarboxylase